MVSAFARQWRSPSQNDPSVHSRPFARQWRSPSQNDPSVHSRPFASQWRSPSQNDPSVHSRSLVQQGLRRDANVMLIRCSEVKCGVAKVSID